MLKNADCYSSTLLNIDKLQEAAACIYISWVNEMWGCCVVTSELVWISVHASGCSCDD